MEKIDKKKLTMLIASIVLPGGLVVLGFWKAYELLKRKDKKNEDVKADGVE